MTHPAVATVMCHCIKNCFGCFTNGFIKKARLNFSAIVNSVDCDRQIFEECLHSLSKYHAKNVHEWENGKCFFHDLFVIVENVIKVTFITCEGKPYQTKNILSCPFHSYCQIKANYS